MPSRLMNRLRERITSIRMTDQGCMLRAYSREVIDALNKCRETNTFIPALAYTFARRPAEIEVAHEERAAGVSKYSLFKLIALNFDLMTGFSIAPLQVVLGARHADRRRLGAALRGGDGRAHAARRTTCATRSRRCGTATSWPTS